MHFLMPTTPLAACAKAVGLQSESARAPAAEQRSKLHVLLENNEDSAKRKLRRQENSLHQLWKKKTHWP